MNPDACVFCRHAVHGPGGCDACEPGCWCNLLSATTEDDGPEIAERCACVLRAGQVVSPCTAHTQASK